MKKGDRVSFSGRTGTIEGFMPAGMVDVRFDDAPGRIERRHKSRLAPVARPNGKARRPRRARRNSKAREAARLRQAESTMRRTTKAKPGELGVDVQRKLRGRGATVFTRPDPPRLSADRKTYCGNPIDGTAYYIVVDGDKRWAPRWITKAEVQAATPPGLEGQDFLDWFREVFIGALDAQRGVEVMVVPMSARKFIKLRGGKRGAASPSKMLKDPELLIKQRKVGPVGSEPDPNIDFSLPDPETGGQVFFRISQWRSPAREKLRSFEAFAFRRFVAPAPNTLRRDDVKEWGALAMALHEASKADLQLRFLGIHPQVCQWLIRSAAVSVNRVIEENPYAKNFEQGDPITVQLKDKAMSMFFSWRPTVVPLSDRKRAFEPCLSEEDLQVRKDLKTMANVLGGFNGSLGRVRSLFRRLAEQPGSLQPEAVMRTITSLANSYAGLVRWYSRLEERYLRGDPIAYRVAQVFLSSVLEPGRESSAFSRAKQAFRTTPGMRGLISGDWLMEQVQADSPDKVKSQLRKIVRRLQRQGNEVEIINEESGIFRSRTPPSEARSHISDGRDYAEFMEGLRSRVLAMQTPGAVRTKIQVGALGGEMTEAEASLAVPPQPGKSALLFLEGADPLPHPMDDLFLYVQPSLSPESYRTLLAMRQEAAKGLELMRRGKSRGGGSRDWEKMVASDPSLKAALRFRTLVGQYAQGGVMTREGLVEPLAHEELMARLAGKRKLARLSPDQLADLLADIAFNLKKPAGWPVPLGQQMDANWAITLVVDDVFPALVWGRGVQSRQAARLSRDLLLLSNLYYLIGGYELTGPLNPLAKPLHQPLLPMARQQAREAEAQVLGGSMGLGSGGNYTVYKTYNPVLFELTRLFWPASTEGSSDPAWGAILAHPQQLADLDAAGRFGHAARVTQQLTAKSRSEEEVQFRLGQLLSPVVGATVANWMRGQAVDPATHRVVRAPEGLYAPFLLNWPLGVDKDGAADMARMWLSDPLAYLKILKENMERAASKLMLTRRVGLPRSKRAPAGDMPFLFADRPAFVPSSTLARVEKAQQDDNIFGMIRELDKAIAQLDKQLKD